MKLISTVFLLLSLFANGEKYSGSMDDYFQFVGKFCFDVTTEHEANNPNIAVPTGKLTIEVTGSVTPTHNLYLLSYSDESDSWGKVHGRSGYDSGMSCEEMLTYSKEYPALAPLNLGTTEVEMGRESSRPHFWFNTIVSLTQNGQAFICHKEDIEYKTHYILYDHNSWNEEFGVNEQGLNSQFLAFFFFYCILVPLNLYGMRKLYKELGYVHPLLKLFNVVLIIQFLSLFAFLLHYGQFSRDGEGMPALEKVGEVLDAFARIVFAVLLILLAKGWAISVHSLSRKKLVIAMSASFAVVYLVMLIWEYAIQDPADTDIPIFLEIVYYIICFIWFLFAIWFAYELYQSYTNETVAEKMKLYTRLGLCFGIWFFTYPLVLIMKRNLDPWVQIRITNAMSLTFTTVGYLFLTFLLWPSRAAEYFSITTPDINKSLNPYNNFNDL